MAQGLDQFDTIPLHIVEHHGLRKQGRHIGSAYIDMVKSAYIDMVKSA